MFEWENYTEEPSEETLNEVKKEWKELTPKQILELDEDDADECCYHVYEAITEVISPEQLDALIEKFNKQVEENEGEELLTLLSKHTDIELGSWSILYNDHTISYCKDVDSIKEYYQPTCEEDIPEWEKDVKDIDWSKPIYHLYWYKDTPVGHYDIIGNSLQDILYWVKRIIKND